MTLAHSIGPEAPLITTTISQNLRDTVERFGTNEALVVPFQNVRMTYRQLDAAVDRVAKSLIAHGMRPGDRLGIWSPNRAEWVLVQLGCARAGVVLVTLNPAYRTHELQYALNQSGCRMVIAAPSFKTSDYVAMIEEVRGECSALEQVVFFDSDGWSAFEESAADVSDVALAEREATLQPSDAINIQYTSGTTGFPKGATLSHTNIVNNGWFVGEGCAFAAHDRVCIPVPLYHCFGMVMGVLGCTTHGATMVFPAPAFDPQATLQTVQDESCTALYGVPTMFIAVLDHPGLSTFDTSSLRTGIMAGSPCPVVAMKSCIDTLGMSEVTIAYGMTETSPVSTQTPIDDTIEHRTGTVGVVHPNVEVKLVDPATGETVQRGETGELCTRGYSVMIGYWNDEAKTAEAIDADGFMHTGDLATMDADGYLNVVGRSKDMVIRGGENVYPREVEEFLATHPDVLDVQVVGVPDRKYGEELCAFVRMRAGATPLTAESVKSFCAGKIAHFKVPRYVQVVEEFPMTVTGKVQKYLLRDRAVDALDLREAASIATA
jgi:fatty-acyl-CoA synthase